MQFSLRSVHPKHIPVQDQKKFVASLPCLSGDEEEVNHVIFVCSNYASRRENLIACASNLNLLWPVLLHAFSQHKPLWIALSNFLSSTKRFKSRR
jgi:hypothetical protein